MIRRISSLRLGAVAIALIAVASLATVARTDDKKAESASSGHHESMQACAKACNDCQRACDMCTMHCTMLAAEGKKDHIATLRSCQDCATICSAAAQVVARGGPHSGVICDACAKACEHCAKMCEKFPQDDHMKKCAEECRKCQKACQDMVKEMALNL